MSSRINPNTAPLEREPVNAPTSTQAAVLPPGTQAASALKFSPSFNPRTPPPANIAREKQREPVNPPNRQAPHSFQASSFMVFQIPSLQPPSSLEHRQIGTIAPQNRPEARHRGSEREETFS